MKNQNWPIKSSFYRGKEWQEREEALQEVLSSSPSSSSSSPPSSPTSPLSAPSSPSSDDSPPPIAHRVVDVTQQPYPVRGRRRGGAGASGGGGGGGGGGNGAHPSSHPSHHPFSLSHSVLLASASADGIVQVWDVTSEAARGGGGGGVQGGAGGGVRLLQRLEGHKGRVYTCAFHPVEPVLVTAGMDSNIKLWTAKP